MTKTSNYQLNQWDKEDRILRTDFNEDNSKIDAAIKTVDTKLVAGIARLDTAVSGRAQYVKLRDITVSQTEAQQLTVDLSDVDFGSWQYLLLDTFLGGRFGGSLRPNGSTAARILNVGSTGSSESGGIALMYSNEYLKTLFPVCRNGAGKIYALTFGNDLGRIANGMADSLTFSQLRSLTFQSFAPDRVIIGGRVVLWGVR